VRQPKVAVVTGGAGGIGTATCARLADDGFTVVVADIDGEAATAVAKEVDAGREQVSGYCLDVTDAASAERMVETLLATRGRIDVLVNNAGFPRDRPLLSMTDDDFRAVVDVALFGAFVMARAVAQPMIDQQYGRIINMSSRAYLGNPGQANYSAAKAGVIGLTRSLAKELGRHNITINAIAPGIVETDAVRAHPKFDKIAELATRQNSIRRLGTPDDIAAAVAYLASPAAGFLTGDVLHLSGGRFS
jgi:3-oxoacyl-[acyl-carrier protein] reductase